jgi:hypothetical protein
MTVVAAADGRTLMRGVADGRDGWAGWQSVGWGSVPEAGVDSADGSGPTLRVQSGRVEADGGLQSSDDGRV